MDPRNSVVSLPYNDSKPTSLEDKEILYKFIKQMQPSSILRTNHKQTIKDYATYFKSNIPYLNNSEVMYLLEGDDSNIGLLSCCGVTDVKTLLSFEVKKSATLALQLLLRLIDPNFNKDASRYLLCFTKVKPKLLKEMKLERHILSNRPDDETPYQLIAIIEEKFTSLDLSYYLESEDARIKYRSWREVQVEVGFEQREEKLPDPVTWDEVQLEVLPDLFDDVQDSAQSHDVFMMMARGLQSQDNEDENIDPLGYADFKISDIKNTQTEKWSDDLLEVEQLTGEKLSHHSRNFDPLTFLSEVHKNTPFAELQLGLSRLKNAVTNRTQQMERLVQEHFDQFVLCKDTIDTIHEMLTPELPLEDGNFSYLNKTIKIQNDLEELRKKTLDIYQPLLARKTEADRIRNVLAILKKFQFLFTLPGTIRKAIENKQYDGVVRAYKKAKSVVVRDVEILQKVHKEVYSIVSEFRLFLLKKLEVHQTKLDDQLKIIGYLIDLDCESDPAFYYLSRQYDWICVLMDDCLKQHVSRIKDLAYDTRPSIKSTPIIEEKPDEIDEWDPSKDEKFHLTKRASATSTRSVIFDVKTPISIASTPHWTSNDIEDDDEKSSIIKIDLSEEQKAENTDTADNTKDVSANKLMKQLCGLISIHIPNFWKLASDFTTGRFARNGISLANNVPRKITLTASSGNGDDNVSDLMLAIATRFTLLIRVILIPNNNASNLVRLSPLALDNLLLLLKCLESFKSLSIPKTLIEPIVILADLAVDYFIKQTLMNSLFSISNLFRDETWILRKEKDVPCVTILPNKFKVILSKSISEVSSISLLKPEVITPVVIGPFLESFKAIADSYHLLSFEMPHSDITNGRNHDHRKLLAVLSNCIYTRTCLLPELWDAFIEIAPKSTQNALSYEFDAILSLFSTLERMNFEEYVRRKILTLNKFVKKGLMMGGINWNEVRTSIEVRCYVLDLLLELVFIHEEVHANTVGEIDSVMQSILEKLALSFWECCKQIDSFNHNGAIQILVEVDLVKQTLSRYLSDDANRKFTNIEELLIPYLESNSDDPYFQSKRKVLLGQAQQSAAMMFECFS